MAGFWQNSDFGQAVKNASQLVPIKAREVSHISTFGRLQGDNVAVIALPSVVVGLHSGVVDAVEVKTVHRADHLPSDVHHLKKTCNWKR